MNIPSFMRSLMLLICMGVATAALAVEVAGQHFEPKVKSGATELTLNGAGIRYKVFFKVYAAALYTPVKSSDAAVILSQKGPRRLDIKLLRDMVSDQLSQALLDGLKANQTAAQLIKIENQLNQLGLLIDKLGSLHSGDTLSLEFADGVTLSQNGTVRGTIPGADFAKALLSVWLGERPVYEPLKKALLGG